MIAAQGTQQSMTKWLSGFDKLTGDRKQKSKGDIGDFLKRFGKGF